MRTLKLTPQKATREIMQELENKGLIGRLTAQNAMIGLDGEDGNAGRTVYSTDPAYGSHKLISVSVGRTDIKTGIGYHPDKEDFLLISNLPGAKPLYFIISCLSADELNKKIADGSLEASDFMLLDMPYGDPEISFFTMYENVIHGEATTGADAPGPVFYVTEPTDLFSVDLDFMDYDLVLE